MINEETILPFTFNGQLALLVMFLPLVSFLVLALWPKENKFGSWLASGFLLLSFIISLILFVVVWQANTEHIRWVWFELSGAVRFTAGIWLNNLTVLMLALVALVSFLVHLFSLEYMKGDAGYNRYFAFLGLFTFSMLGIVLSDNLLVTFVFWELVGLSSYLLIGFWFHKKSAALASKKAFLVNRIGDIGFLVGLMILWLNYKTLDLTILGQVVNINDPVLITATLCLFGGVIGKSAQFPLLVWLPDAMEGPTPVSALIHAATMVAAGVFLLARIAPLVPIEAGQVIALTGGITALMGAVAAMRQFDIKKILAFSTISQLGYMVLGAGAGAADAAIFHLITHAFFKACLFLSAGAIIHSLHHVAHQHKADFDAQDIRIMGGLRTRMPVVFWAFTLSAMALMGVPLFSGFLSKDAILIAASGMSGGWQWIIPTLGFATVLLTAYYVIRMLLLVFSGENRLTSKTQIGEFHIPPIPMVMTLPLAVLTFGALFFVFSANPVDASHSWLMEGLGKGAAQHGLAVPVSSVVLVLTGATLAYFRFNPAKHKGLNIQDTPNYTTTFQSLSFNNWHLDRVYEFAFVKPVLQLGQLIQKIERKIIDGFIDAFGIAHVVLAKIIGWLDRYVVDGLVHLSAALSRIVGWFSKSTQSGQVQTHIAWAALGVLLLLFWLVL